MSMRLNKEGYEQLINEDIAWLEKSSSDTLERRHIIAVLLTSIYHEYYSFTPKDLLPVPCEEHGKVYCDDCFHQ